MTKRTELYKAYKRQTRQETVLEGIGVSHGIAIGSVYLVQVENPVCQKQVIDESAADAEILRFDKAVSEAEAQIHHLKAKSQKLPDATAEDVQLLLDAHLAMLSGSRLVKGVKKEIGNELVNAEYAVSHVMGKIVEQFEAMKDPYLAARVDDIRAVGNRVLRILMNLPYMSLDAVPKGGIVLAEEITPADTALLDPRQFGGIATIHGGSAGHTAVMARSLGLPAVLGVQTLLEKAHHGDIAIIDGINGKIIIRPEPQTLAQYQEQLDALEAEKKELAAIRFKAAETRDGVPIALRANLEMPRDIEAALDVNADGVGLFRTEFMFMNRNTLPDEDEQYEMMAEVVRAAGQAGVTFRTLDIGGDKLAKSVGQHMADCDNPALGLRAIRLSLEEPKMLKTQLRAILRASALGPVRILLPMVTNANEVRAVRRYVDEAAAELQAEGKEMAAEMPPLGVMIEIPAAALSADSLATVSDFFALGTNDLIQYTVAIDRGNDMVAALYEPLNPAVLRLIEFTVQAALRARIPVSICGEMAADTKYTGLLMGLGIREMSVGPAALPLVKKRIRSLDLVNASRHAQLVMSQYDIGRITTLVNEFNQK